VKAAKCFDAEVITIPKSQAGANAKAPSVYLNDRVIAEIGFLKKGTISLEELINQLKAAGVPERPDKGGCNCGVE
jgi:hypothetical protein